MQDLAKSFVAEARRYLTSSYLPKLERALAALDDEGVWWRPNEASNSIGNLMLHLAGSTRMWIVSVVGGSPDARVRQQEFDERAEIPAAELLARLRSAVADADAVLADLRPEQLLERREVQGEETSVLDCVFHAVEHFSMHTGQIILLVKLRSGADLELSK